MSKKLNVTFDVDFESDGSNFVKVSSGDSFIDTYIAERNGKYRWVSDGYESKEEFDSFLNAVRFMDIEVKEEGETLADIEEMFSYSLLLLCGLLIRLGRLDIVKLIFDVKFKMPDGLSDSVDNEFLFFVEEAMNKLEIENHGTSELIELIREYQGNMKGSVFMSLIRPIEDET